MLDAVLRLLREQPSRTGALVVTLFGDAVVPRGGTLPVAALLELFRAMDVADGVVRTAVSRLAADGWLVRMPELRPGHYGLSNDALAETERARPTIYGPLSAPWDGTLPMALAETNEARGALAAAGFGAVMQGVYLGRPGGVVPAGLALRVQADAAAWKDLAARAWKLDALAARYRAFLSAFADAPGPLPPVQAMLARLVLAHEYRRVVLRDPHLPQALLPAPWPGLEARTRTRTLYAAVFAASEAWLDGWLPALGHARDPETVWTAS